MAALRMPLIMPDEYLALEEKATYKSEYISGEIFAMAGGKPPHNMIAMDTSRILGNLLDTSRRSCDVHNSDQKVRIEEPGPFFYPDVSVVCGDPVFDAAGCLRNPVLIVEVLSDSTAHYDRGEKFRHYRRLDSLKHYVLIHSEMVRVEHYEKQGDIWIQAGEYTNGFDSVSLSNLGIDVPLTEIYRRVSFNP
jgi:Uma2 family endonuclease